MPVYEFSCSSGCENYEVWRTIDSRQQNTDCPECGAQGSRVFSPPMTLTGSFRLKQESKEPVLVSGQKQAERRVEKPRLRESSIRPWMVTRGC
ncbi:FmdB family zinc ribbon protein [Synechococcus sp. CCY9202]|uniref:FmdB family zinc ribbon protein n=1 Tax=Synechococcus sp. CCY9202 TaxID=174698 RepID=UPI002B21960A|nr:FmdB family zinc ribbon protein [Synechococcus sp. CCY9202]MEA5423865.1 FmdB family zinc ribbon protein [Synechococcus sp. CCY9202]